MGEVVAFNKVKKSDPYVDDINTLLNTINGATSYVMFYLDPAMGQSNRLLEETRFITAIKTMAENVREVIQSGDRENIDRLGEVFSPILHTLPPGVLGSVCLELPEYTCMFVILKTSESQHLVRDLIVNNKRVITRV